jgi:hypothetical protein
MFMDEQKIYYNGREIILVKKEGSPSNVCHGCLFEVEPLCSLGAIDYPCWNRNEKYCKEVTYVFKYKEEAE